MLKKPESKNDLLPPFRWIGEDGWENKARQILLDYEVPLPTPASEAELRQCEEHLGISLPEPFKLFHLAFGAVNFGVPTLFPLNQIVKGPGKSEIYFFDVLRTHEKAILHKIAIIGEPAADFLILDLEDGRCGELSHDPLGFVNWLPSFDDLIQCAFIGLCCGYYGWPDDELEKWAESLTLDLYGVRI